jgi:endoglucanase
MLILGNSLVSFSQGFLKASGTKIVNGSGEEIILRGMGIGGWMLQEPYMLQLSDVAANQTAIKNRIINLVGADAAETFYDAWLDNFFTRQDVDSLARYGFNSIRLPMHYNLFTLPIELEPVPGEQTWLDRGFALTDSVLGWCKANNMYLILDLHAAPGGQGKDQAISDYTPSKHSLWEDTLNQKKTVELWRKLAQRYASEEWIGAYDVINEPNWSFGGVNANGCDEQTNAPLKKLLKEITSAIREVDTNHIVIIEGNCWGGNYNGLTPPWDTNMVYSFHKYWNENTTSTIQGMLNLRNNNNVPIWLGESGENSNHWFAGAIRLMETNNIGWAWWPLKKIQSVVGPYSITLTPEYQSIINYWKNGGSSPSPYVAANTLMDLAQRTRLSNCTFSPDVFDAMMRQPFDVTIRPYGPNNIPGTIFASQYDMGRNTYSYSDQEYQNTGGTYNYNQGYTGRNDGVDLEACSDFTKGYNVGWIVANEWMKYTVNSAADTFYDVEIRYASLSGGGVLKLEVDGVVAASQISLPSTGGWQNWSSKTVTGIHVPQGKHVIRVFAIQAGFNLNFLKFTEGLSTLVMNEPEPGITVKQGQITLTDPEFSNFTLKIYDITGRLLLSGNGYNSSFYFNPDPFRNNVVLISLLSQNGKKSFNFKYLMGN